MQDKVTRLRQIMSEAIPLAPAIPPSQAAANEAFAYFDANGSAGIAIEQTPQARAIRDIMRIASWYGWSSEITRAMDAASASTLHDLMPDDLDLLHRRMRTLEDCVHTGSDAPDSPPAR